MLLNVTLEVKQDRLIFNADVKDGYKPGQSYSISYKANIKSECKCLDIIAPARVNVEAYSTVKEENFMSYDVVKESCKANDNNCATVKYTLPCPEVPKTLDYSIVKTIIDNKNVYKEGETVKFNNKVDRRAHV